MAAKPLRVQPEKKPQRTVLIARTRNRNRKFALNALYGRNRKSFKVRTYDIIVYIITRFRRRPLARPDCRRRRNRTLSVVITVKPTTHRTVHYCAGRDLNRTARNFSH